MIDGVQVIGHLNLPIRGRIHMVLISQVSEKQFKFEWCENAKLQWAFGTWGTETFDEMVTRALSNPSIR
jgi:hypothetical protein